ncbi:ROK family transcriptional regulator [Streptomyces sp. H27-D2]|uniref:ROK family transcriptional regulator n=1 Tax=Streptomyces sp. H27-D2 TaxID=3046304 RepID=UPI002DBF1A84|nr:ROK family transcriptional regulator [Streptomyces sp. H27-D2]MEC4015168.1 ROK family transcriptional regulator [Streptomyces sp. H27-D2]
MNSTFSGANLSALRSHNAALVLGLLRAAGESGVSRLELAAHTGLTPQAVSKITSRLRAEGLAAEAGQRASTGGKPRTVLRLVRDANSAVGLHLDRDELTVVLADLTGEPVAVRSAPFDFGADPEWVVREAAAQVTALLAETAAEGGYGPVLGVGVACPGPLDHGSGVLRRVTGLVHWDGFALRSALAARLGGLPVLLDKDTNAAALGLAPRGARDTADSFAYLHLGTGLGAGLVLGGVLHRGARTGAGEFGHQVVRLDGPVCGCGNRGCVEALCLAAVAAGDPAEAARMLGVGAANLVGLLDIDRVVLGGRTVLAADRLFVRGVEAVLAERAARGDGRTVPVAVAGSGARAVAEGAAQLILAPLFGRPDGSFRDERM